ncbi:ATP-binding cassette, subfamily A (ABC1), member 6 [Ruminococcus sp. YE71]|uniref:hypothetical protein n=1 Tax=unclassified Ruminococcus TaxID=2608920 RepID=UPI000882080A|nr:MULTISPECIES: hypothetical protein [unclassified Ruminococcus]SDA30399.1 ATP-binding cassette, subfamily A (ABC1), member 6 [Ruminococcus sp. YE78]SFW49564.1 ATP-binding cassette, subfamily A (ABC1), member 6 [Ruminococcus sp. YE71]
MADNWKEKLYEPEGELIKVENVNFSGPEPHVEGEELITIDSVDLSYSGKTGSIKALENIHFNIYPGNSSAFWGLRAAAKARF